MLHAFILSANHSISPFLRPPLQTCSFPFLFVSHPFSSSIPHHCVFVPYSFFLLLRSFHLLHSVSLYSLIPSLHRSYSIPVLLLYLLFFNSSHSSCSLVALCPCFLSSLFPSSSFLCRFFSNVLSSSPLCTVLFSPYSSYSSHFLFPSPTAFVLFSSLSLFSFFFCPFHLVSFSSASR